jgi:hypothetical protein
MALPLINVTQTIHGYCDPNVYGVVVAFKRFGDRQEYTAYVDFDRKTGKLNSPTEVGEEPEPGKIVAVEMPGSNCHAILRASRVRFSFEPKSCRAIGSFSKVLDTQRILHQGDRRGIVATPRRFRSVTATRRARSIHQ